jgi:hypothetical protein
MNEDIRQVVEIDNEGEQNPQQDITSMQEKMQTEHQHHGGEINTLNENIPQQDVIPPQETTQISENLGKFSSHR